MFDSYRNRMNMVGGSVGEMLRRQSNAVIEYTWDRDPNARKIYVVRVDSGLPDVTYEHELIDAKFNVKTYENINSDEPSYWMQFRHGEEKRHPEIAIGSYVYMENEDHEWTWWIIMDIDARPSFRQYQILETNYVFRWITDGRIYETLGIQRIQQSYNSGSWKGDRFTFVDNITSAILPTNNDTVTLSYNHRLMITDPRRPTPLVWSVSKVEDSTPFGLTEFKFTQDTYSPTLDNKELMLCNYYSSEIEPEHVDLVAESKCTATITYSGTKPTIKVGGSFKTFSAAFTKDSVVIDQWFVSYEDGNISEDQNNYVVEYDDANNLKLKVAQNYNLIGKVLIVKVVGTDGSTDEVKMEVVG